MCRHFRKLAPLLAIAIALSPAEAVTLDWDAVTWTSGSLSNSYDIDPAHAGNDVTVSVATSGGAVLMSDPTTGAASPTRNTSLAGGLNPAQNTLKLTADISADSAFVMITIDFAAWYPQGVQNLSFTLFDIDLNGSSYRGQDEISGIVGMNGATSIAPTITGVGSSVTHIGTGLNQHLIGNADAFDTGATSSAGNATISFGSSAVTSVTFRWDRGPEATGSSPTTYIGLHDINFTPVPEINPAITAALSCFAATGLMFFHRARVRSRRQ